MGVHGWSALEPFPSRFYELSDKLTSYFPCFALFLLIYFIRQLFFGPCGWSSASPLGSILPACA